MTWAEFNAEIRTYLTVHNRRQGIQALIDTLIKTAAIDLQTTTAHLQNYHEDTLTPEDLTVDNFASYGNLPAGEIRSARLISLDPDTATHDRLRYLYLNQVSARNWLDFAGGIAGNGEGSIFLDPIRRQFAFVPALGLDSLLIIEWDGVKEDFEDADITPFDRRCAQAAAKYVLSFLCRSIDNDQASSLAYERGYLQAKRIIYSDGLSRARMKIPTRPTAWQTCRTAAAASSGTTSGDTLVTGDGDTVVTGDGDTNVTGGSGGSAGDTNVTGDGDTLVTGSGDTVVTG